MTSCQISGVGDAGIAFRAGDTAINLAATAARVAIADAGLTPANIDGLAVTKIADLRPGDMPSMQLADHLGLRPSYVDNTLAGGASSVIQVGHARDAIAASRCRHVLVVYSSTQASERRRVFGTDSRGAGQARTQSAVSVDAVVAAERAAGLPYPIGPNALAAAMHGHRYGSTPEQLAAVAVSARCWAARNPAALRREPLSIAEAMQSPILCSPLRKVDACLVTDGAGAVVVSDHSADPRGVAVRGFAEFHRHRSILSASDLLTTGATVTGPRAMSEAGLGHRDIGLLQLYDAFTILPIVLIENLGFVAAGRAGALFLDGATQPSGHLPVNTQGGGLAHCHPGAYGIFLIIEAVRQLRGEADDRQVAAPRACLVQGAGGGAFGGSQATLILDQP